MLGTTHPPSALRMAQMLSPASLAADQSRRGLQTAHSISRVFLLQPTPTLKLTLLNPAFSASTSALPPVTLGIQHVAHCNHYLTAAKRENFSKLQISAKQTSRSSASEVQYPPRMQNLSKPPLLGSPKASRIYLRASRDFRTCPPLRYLQCKITGRLSWSTYGYVQTNWRMQRKPLSGPGGLLLVVPCWLVPMTLYP